MLEGYILFWENIITNKKKSDFLGIFPCGLPIFLYIQLIFYIEKVDNISLKIEIKTKGFLSTLTLINILIACHLQLTISGRAPMRNIAIILAMMIFMYLLFCNQQFVMMVFDQLLTSITYWTWTHIHLDMAHPYMCSPEYKIY